MRRWCFIVAGGASIGQNLTVCGNETVDGAETVIGTLHVANATRKCCLQQWCISC